MILAALGFLAAIVIGACAIAGLALNATQLFNTTTNNQKGTTMSYAPQPISTDDIENRFAHHPPKDPGISAAHVTVRNAIKTTAHFVVGQIPPGREASLAVTALEEAMFWANAAIARDHEYFHRTPAMDVPAYGSQEGA